MIDNTDPRTVWQNQPEENSMLVLEKLQRDMTRFHEAARWRNTINYISLPVGIISFAFVIHRIDNSLVRIGGVILLLGLFVSIYDIFRNGKPADAPFGLSISDTVGFWKSELVRRLNLRRRQFWILVVLCGPGVVLIFAGISSVRSGSTIHFVVASVIYMIFAAGWQWRRANQMRKQIGALPRIDEV